MATRNIVPRDEFEGQIGTGEKPWKSAYIGNVSVTYDTVADMKADAELRESMTAKTNGYYSINDGNAATYKIRNKEVADLEDNENIIFLNNGKVAEKIKKLEIKYGNDGWFRFGVMDKTAYCNGLATDGTNFYLGQYNTNGNSYIIKLDGKGIELARYTSDSNYHYNDLTWDAVNNCLYALKTTTTLQKFDSDLNLLDTITLPVAVFGISFDVLYGGFYGISSQYVYKFDDTFTVIETKDMPIFPTPMTEGQGMLVYGERIFFARNYPNTIFEYNLTNMGLIKETKFGSDIDGTYLGEIEGLCAYPTENGMTLHVSFALAAIETYYNTVFALNSADIQSFVPPFANTSNPISKVYHYVDAQSAALYSNGSSSAPWKSLNECLMHTAIKRYYRIFVVNAHPTFDCPTSEKLVPEGTYEIEYSGAVPNSFFRFNASNLFIQWRNSNSAEISIANCRLRLVTNYANSDPSHLTLTARSSDVTILGNINNVYNADGIVHVVKGKVGTSSGRRDLVFDASDFPVQSKNLTIQGRGTVRFAAKNSNKTLAAIIAFTGTNGEISNDVFIMKGYGAGGTDRTKIYRFPLSSSTSVITPTVDPNANAINFAITGTTTETIYVTATMLSGYANDVDLTFTAS